LELVLRLNDRWGIFNKDGDLIILPFTKLLCPMIWYDTPCLGEMLLHDFVCVKDPDGKVHCDVHLKCTRCGYHVSFGLSIPEGMLHKIRSSKYHGKTLRYEIKDIYGSIPKDVEQRLRDWSYW